MKYCKNCRKYFPDTASFCGSCGMSLQQQGQEDKQTPYQKQAQKEKQDSLKKETADSQVVLIIVLTCALVLVAIIAIVFLIVKKDSDTSYETISQSESTLAVQDTEQSQSDVQNVTDVTVDEDVEIDDAEDFAESEVLTNAELMALLIGLWDYSGNAGKTGSWQVLKIEKTGDVTYQIIEGWFESESIYIGTFTEDDIVQISDTVYLVDIFTAEGEEITRVINILFIEDGELYFGVNGDMVYNFMGSDISTASSKMYEKYITTSSTTTNDVSLSDTESDLGLEDVISVLETHYNMELENSGDDGTYVIFSNEVMDLGDTYLFPVRYQMGEQRIAELEAEGIIGTANVMRGEIILTKATGEISGFGDSWNIYD